MLKIFNLKRNTSTIKIMGYLCILQSTHTYFFLMLNLNFSILDVFSPSEEFDTNHTLFWILGCYQNDLGIGWCANKWRRV